MKLPIEEKNGKKSIVVIDDNQLILTFLHDYLKKEYRVNAFTSGTEAINYVDSEDGKVDCVITDFQLSNNFSGMEILSHLNKSNPSLPVVLLSGSSKTDVKVDCIRKGARDFISKPFHPAELAARIQNII